MKSIIYFSLLLVALAWFEPLLPSRLTGTGATVAAADVVSYTLVDADSDLDILTLTPGIVLNLGTLPSRNLNIRANTSAGAVGSVVFALSGTQTVAHTENVAPYALFSDFQGDYFAWVPPVGSYTLAATTFTGADGTGTAGATFTLSFSFVNSVGSVGSFTLVNADTDLDILTITSGSTLNLSALPRNLNIRANTIPTTVGSVELNLTGAQTRFETQNVAPYALFGDFQGDYFAWAATAGSYSLTATPFETTNGGGSAGTALSITFTFTGTSPLAVQLTAFSAEAQGTGAVQLRWNTASEENNQEFEVQRSTDGKAFGVLSHVAGHGSTTSAHDYRYTDAQPPSTTTLVYYRLRQVDTDGTAAYSPVRTVVLKSHVTAVLEAFSPVVADGLLYYTYSGPSTGTEQLEVYTLLGQRRGQYPLAAAGAGSVPVDGLAPGAYVLRLMSDTGHYTSRFVLP